MSTPSFKIKGVVERLLDTEFVSDKFKKRIIVLYLEDDKDPKYSQHVPIEFTQQYCDTLDSYTEGDHVEIDFELQGREYNSKFYSSLKGWKIQKEGGQTQSAPKKQEPQPAAAPKATPVAPNYDDRSDLPF